MQNSIDAYFSFIDKKIWSEEGHDGSGYIAWAYDSEKGQKELFLDYLENLLMNKNMRHIDRNINNLYLEYEILKEKRDSLFKNKEIRGINFSVTLDSCKETDTLWQAYKNTIIDSMKKQISSENREELEKWIYQKRIDDLLNVIQLYYDYE